MKEFTSENPSPSRLWIVKRIGNILITKKTLKIIITFAWGCIIFVLFTSDVLHPIRETQEQVPNKNSKVFLATTSNILTPKLNSTKMVVLKTTQKYTEKETEPDLEPVNETLFGLHERLMRKIRSEVTNLWYRIQDQRSKLESENFEAIRETYQNIQSDLHTFSSVDGFQAFRIKETEELGKIVQANIRRVQNPEDCYKGKLFVCEHQSTLCGLGCNVHHLVYCLMVAHYKGGALVLRWVDWRFVEQEWETFFRPLSDTCNYTEGNLSGNYETIVYNSKETSPLAVTIPYFIGHRLQRVHSNPLVWWVGQFMKYLLRLQPQVQERIDSNIRKLDKTKSPIVGVHVRRTDKIGSEASFHSLQEYMTHVDDFFSILELTQGNLTRRVFIATDEPTVLTEAYLNYTKPKWEIIGDMNVSRSAGVIDRTSREGLTGVISDIYMLAECDFLVCTFSSRVCRAAYEIRQTKNVDGAESFVSLDDQYYFTGGPANSQIVHIPHRAGNDEEIDLEVGDVIELLANFWNGLSKGTNVRTGKTGLFPSYKARTTFKMENPDSDA